jgi:hypothetical protein
MQSNQTSSQQGGFFAAHPTPIPIAEAFALQTSQNHGCNYFALLRTLKPLLLQKLAMPSPTHKPCTVLSGFAQSFPADGKCQDLNMILSFLIKL